MIKIQQKNLIQALSATTIAVVLSGCNSSSSVVDEGGIIGTGSGAPTSVTETMDGTSNTTDMDSTSGGTDTTDTDDNSAVTGGTDTTNGTDTESTDATDSTDTTNSTDTTDSTDSTDTTDSTDNTATTENTNTSTSVTSGAAGLLETGTPGFGWTAVDGADSYQVVLTEAEGNKITYTASTELCAGTECNASPTAAFHNNSIDWQVNAMSGGNVISSAASGSYSTPRRFDLTPVTSDEANCSIWPSISYDDVIILNNIWNVGQVYSNAWSQKIAATESNDSSPIASWTYDYLTETDGDRTAVKAYPEIIYGNKLGTHVSGTKEQTGLPEIVTQLPEFNVEFAYTETLEGDVERNVALESFFHTSCDVTGPCDLESNSAYEMMVWVENPGSNRPGDLAVTGVEIDNRLWDVYIKPRSDKKYIAFTAQTPFSEGTLQWNRFVEWTMQWTAENGAELQIETLTPNLCMAAIEMGTELWWGKGSFTLDKFNVTRN